MSEPTIIIFDFMGTLYDPVTNALREGAGSLLTSLDTSGVVLYLVTRAEGQRRELFTSLGITPFFAKIYLVENKYTAFKEIRERHSDSRVWVVGDRVRGEIRHGNELGMTTVWLQRGRFADELPQATAEFPDHTMASLDQLSSLITP